MPSILPVNVEDLLACRGVESQRVEFKAGWDPKTTGPQVLRTICAFANNLQNLNGGYVVIGVAEQDGRAEGFHFNPAPPPVPNTVRFLLQQMTVRALRHEAKERGLAHKGMRKPDLVRLLSSG